MRCRLSPTADVPSHTSGAAMCLPISDLVPLPPYSSTMWPISRAVSAAGLKAEAHIRRAAGRSVDIMGRGYGSSECASKSRGGFVFPIEKQRWILSIGGNHGDAPPGDREGFLDFVKSFRTSTIYDAVKDARPTADIVRFRHPASSGAILSASSCSRQACSRWVTRCVGSIRYSDRA